MTKDRAGIVARVVLQMVVQHLFDGSGDLRTELAGYLRDEFYDVARQTKHEIRREDE